MNKKLFTQIKNEWRSNTWLAIELLVVSVIMWYITDMLYCYTATYLEPRGFDISHCYLIQMGKLNEQSPDYVAYQSPEEETVLPTNKKSSKKGSKKPSMSFFTALSLSLNNLMTKKARTFLTSFAGSIGIIGIALIIALSSGVNLFIENINPDYRIDVIKELSISDTPVFLITSYKNKMYCM